MYIPMGIEAAFLLFPFNCMCPIYFIKARHLNLYAFHCSLVIHANFLTTGIGIYFIKYQIIMRIDAYYNSFKQGLFLWWD